ncbi:Putative multidrug export ATP-binding/permease protein [Gimesia alba]|uniref:Multidrug export ATP-binding/permease protein n=1 Tax=Gimesia alba TaxID=2527973 RepID=A0A517RJ75_9PLAN|nr:ABC transporter ATP-binding protein [Gimesia alba]QDT43925.1 Putative multidrug export ATP-binding/permease protein [Gimesia alba]
MSNRQPNAFHRAFPAREFFRGSARSVLFWSLINGLVLVCLLVDVFLIVDLLNHRGRITVRGEQNVQLLQKIRNVPPLVIPPVEAESDAPPAEAETEKKQAEPAAKQPASQPEEKQPVAPAPVNLNLSILTDSGILPSVWWLHSKYQLGIMSGIYQRVPLLQENQTALFTLILVALILASIRVLIRWRARQRSLKISHHVSTTLRNMIHRQALRLGPGDLSGKETDQAFHLFIKDVGTVQNGVFEWVYQLSRHPLALLILLLFAISIDWRLTLQCLIPLAAAWYFLSQHRKEYEIQHAKTLVNIESELSLLAENLRSTRLVRGYGMETAEHEQFQKYLDKYTDNLDKLKRVEGWGHRIARGLAVFCSCLVLFLVGYKVLVNPESLPLSAAIILVGIFAFFYLPVNGLYQLMQIRNTASIAASSIYRYLNQIPEVSQAVGAKFQEPLSQSLQFENVSYSQSANGPKILNGFDIKIPAGTSTALVSLETLAPRAVSYLIPRFIEPKSGRVLMDGEDTAWVTLESLRAEAIYVSGNDPCLTGTVKENIQCGDERYSLQEIIAASKEAHAHQFIQNLPQGYETALGQHGEELTVGESFRLGLARALLRKPALMIIEEPEEALDDDTKTLLEDAYTRIFQNRTILVIPSRITTLRRVDQVVLIHEGKVEAVDSQSNLLKKSALYRHWEYTRFNQFRHSQES